jgi:hypothetical protein
MIFRYKRWVLAAVFPATAITAKTAIPEGDEINLCPPVNSNTPFQSGAPLHKRPYFGRLCFAYACRLCGSFPASALEKVLLSLFLQESCEQVVLLLLVVGDMRDELLQQDAEATLLQRKFADYSDYGITVFCVPLVEFVNESLLVEQLLCFAF